MSAKKPSETSGGEMLMKMQDLVCPPKPSTTSKPVEELKVIEYPDGFRFGNGDDIIVSSEILHKYIQKQVLEGRIDSLHTAYEDIGAETENGVPDENAWRTVLLQTIADLEGSGKPPAQNKDALQTNNKEKDDE